MILKAIGRELDGVNCTAQKYGFGRFPDHILWNRGGSTPFEFLLPVAINPEPSWTNTV